MIRAHHFFEGSVEHRLDPETVVRVLNIQPNIEYGIKYIDTYKWREYTASRFSFANDDPNKDETFYVLKNIVWILLLSRFLMKK